MTEPAAPPGAPPTRAGQVAGLALLALGILLLVAVFVWAYLLFSSLAAALGGSEAAHPGEPSLGALLGAGGLRVGFLFVMGYVSSLLASKGLHLFAISRGVKPE
jgi:hypothetical protein